MLCRMITLLNRWNSRPLHKYGLFLLVGGLAVTIFSGCEGGRPEASRGKKTSRESLVFVLGNDISNMDPAQMTDIESGQVASQVYEGLVRFKDGSVEVEPCLAESWQVTEDGLEWVFKLREGIRFSDGSPVNADAVVFSVQRQTDPNHEAHVPGRMRYANLLFGDASSTETELLRSVEAIDERTVRFRLARPYMPFIFNLAMVQASVVSPSSVRLLKSDINTTMVGTGAFLLESYRRDQRITVVRNDNYWGEPADVEHVEFRVLRDPNTRLNSLRRGDCHVIAGIEPYSLDLLKGDDGVTVLSEPSMNLGYLSINCKEAPFDDPRVRLAVNYAIDKEFICEVLYNGTSVMATGVLPPGMLGHDPERKGIPYDPDKARELLKEAGYENGFEFTFNSHNRARIYVPVGIRLAEQVQQDLAKVGIRANIDQMEFPAFLEREKSRNYVMGNSGWISDNGDPDNFIFEIIGREDNSLNYSNPEATRLMRLATVEKDVEKRAQLYYQAEELIAETAPIVPLNHALQIMAIRNEVRGFVMHPTGVNRLDSVSVISAQ